eukprot:6451366-Prymnesium_polylepis.1
MGASFSKCCTDAAESEVLTVALAEEGNHDPVADACQALVNALSRAEDAPADATARDEVVERAAQFALAL